MEYTIYNKITGEIIKNLTCSAENLLINYDNNVEDYIKGCYNKISQKILNGEVVEKSQDEKDIYQYNQIKNTFPSISKDLNDTDLNSLLNTYFYGKVDIQQYRIDNYAWLRKKFYPPIADYDDAQVKLNSGISELETEGQAQLDNYIQECLNVKKRFPKE